MQVVTSYEQALAAAREFQKVSKAPDSIAFAQLGRYFHWHYFEEMNGFAPSKFIGYAGTTVRNYKSEGMGTETNRALQEFFIKISRPSQQFDSLAEQLSAWLSELDKPLSSKTLNGTGGIYVSRNSNQAQELQYELTANELPSDSKHYEGNPYEVRQTRYERDPKARKQCLQHYGYSCQACSLNFEVRYGEIGREFIHVHHIDPLSSLGSEHETDPIKDLIPLCPNCHAMIHKLPSPQTLESLRQKLR